jgi:mono/diheme cytochrome c family protein
MRWLLATCVATLLGAGCGQTEYAPVPSKGLTQHVAKPLADPVQLGQQLFARWGCVMCHGPDGKSGIKNPNAKTNEQVPPVIYVAEGYKPDELKQFIRRGQPNIDKMRADGSTPPLRMPSYAGWLADAQLDALQKYLFSLHPVGEEEKF